MKEHSFNVLFLVQRIRSPLIGTDHFQVGVPCLRCLNGTAPVYLADSINRGCRRNEAESAFASQLVIATVDVPVTRQMSWLSMHFKYRITKGINQFVANFVRYVTTKYH